MDAVARTAERKGRQMKIENTNKLTVSFSKLNVGDAFVRRHDPDFIYLKVDSGETKFNTFNLNSNHLILFPMTTDCIKINAKVVIEE